MMNLFAERRQQKCHTVCYIYREDIAYCSHYDVSTT